MLGAGEYKLWSTGYWDLLRKLMPRKDRQTLPLPHSYVIATLGLEHPDDAIRAQRAFWTNADSRTTSTL